MKNIVGGLYAASEWIMRFSVTNLLWLLVNLPIVFGVVNLLKAEEPSHFILFLIPTVVLAPVIFFPATAALFACARDWLLDQDGGSLVASYLKYFKENFKKCVLGGSILTVLWVILAADYFYLREQSPILGMVFIVFGLILYVYTINFFSVNAHYDLKLRDVMKKAMLITVGSPILLLAVSISGIILLYASINGPLFLFIFFTGALTAFLSFSAFYRLYLNITIKNQSDSDK